jgi:hypothetical protein
MGSRLNILIFYSAFAEPINYQCFLLSPRAWTAIFRFPVEKQMPILNTGRSPARTTLAGFGLPNRRPIT